MNKVYQGNETVINRILASFDKECFLSCGQYELARIRYDDCIITVYKSHKVMFQGKNAEIYAAAFFPEEMIQLPQCGSDEVGTGDFFGPVCVCACYLDEEIYGKISSLNIRDSKQLDDPQIIKIAEQLINTVPHSLLILDNEKYNQVNRDNNMNRIKARMHNKAYLNLRNKVGDLGELVVLDDFCGRDNYFRYLKGEPEVYPDVVFQTKAENKYPAVACGALISRYGFLKTLDAMSEKYQMTFPKGAGAPADEFAEEFVNKYGKSELLKVAKCNFANYRKL